MNELIQKILATLRGMWHRRWFGLAAAWIAAIVCVVVVYRIPERFEASARVYVDTQSLLRPVMAGLAIQPNLDQQVALMSRTLISRPNVEKLVRMADLDLRITTNAEREELIDALTRSLQLAGNVSTNLYVISYRDADTGKSEKGRLVAAHHLRRVEPGRQAAGYARRGQVPGRADQALRGHPAGGGEPPQGLQTQVHGHFRAD